jgi:hypothetical protein
MLKVVNYATEHSDEVALLYFGIKSGTLKRYRKEIKKRKKGWRMPKVLLLDIETLPMVIHSWSLFMKNYSPKNIIHPTLPLMWAAKWLYSTEIMSDILTPGEAINRDDSRILKSVWKLMDEADIIIAHNGDRFDIKKLNGFFFHHDMMPPSDFQSIDTLKQSYKTMNLDSHKQEWITRYRCLEEKFETDYMLWVRCANGEQEALDEMESYCEQDVNGLEDMYIALLPWMKSHPNMGIYMDADASVCAGCGGQHLKRDGDYVTTAGTYPRYRCLDCGHQSKSRFSSLSPEQKRNLLVSTAR